MFAWLSNFLALSVVCFLHRISLLPSGVLQIVNVSQKDAGDYRCIAQNIADKRRSQPAALVVEPRVGGGPETDYIPQIIAGPISLTRVVGESAIFECLVDGEESTLEVTWSRQGELIIPPPPCAWCLPECGPRWMEKHLHWRFHGADKVSCELIISPPPLCAWCFPECGWVRLVSCNSCVH